MEDAVISSQRQIVTISTPVTHDLKFKSDISMMKKNATKYDMLSNSLSCGRYSGSEIGDKRIGTDASMVLHVGMSCNGGTHDRWCNLS